MDKAEELKLQRLVEFIRGYKTTNKKAREIIQAYADEYAQQVSRDKERISFKAGLEHAKDVITGLKSKNWMDDLFDKWIENQQ